MLTALFLCINAVKMCGSSRPNIVFFMVDDLGWGNVGYHREGSTKIDEIKTPNLDKYAKKWGLELNRHYVHPTCTPTRSSFFSGRLPVHVQDSLVGPEEPHSGIPRHMQTFPKLLKKQGYRNHIVGKWDAGFASFEHTPKGRGFDSSLIYMEHGSEYWTHKIDALVAKCAYFPGYEHLNDLWEHDDEAGIEEGPARNYNDYIEYHFRDRAIEIINNHATNHQGEPLFLMYASHLHHQPLQVPEEELIGSEERFPSDPWLCAYSTQYVHETLRNPRDFGCRRIYTSMVRMTDRIFDTLMKTLRKTGLWENTLVVFSSDNGGSTWLMEGAASNYPLRGGKYSEFEGGTRAVSFVTGGFLPEFRRGKIENRMIHVVDWYATFSSLAGLKTKDEIEDTQGIELYEYPGIDSLDVSDVILKPGVSSPREGYHLTERAVVDGEFKFIIGVMDSAGLPTVLYPTNATVFGKTGVDDFKMDCSGGCLFNVVNDPAETTNLAIDPEYSARASIMSGLLTRLNEKIWINSDSSVDNSCPTDCPMKSECLKVCPKEESETRTEPCIPCGCWMSKHYWGNSVGPFQFSQKRDVRCPDKEVMKNCPDKIVTLPSHTEL